MIIDSSIFQNSPKSEVIIFKIPNIVGKNIGETEIQAIKLDVLLLEQFYKRDENIVLFHVFDILCEQPEKKVLYNDICSRYNEKFASSKKRCAN